MAFDSEGQGPPRRPSGLGIQGKGPAEDPRAAAYYPTVRLMVSILEQEVAGGRETVERRPGRRQRRGARVEAVLEDFGRRCREILALAKEGESLEAQFQAMSLADSIAIYKRVVVPSDKGSKGPDSIGLLSEYHRVYPAVKVALGASKSRDDFRAVARRLLAEFGDLSEEVATEAARLRPSDAAHVVLGARHSLSPDRIRKRLRDARREVRSWPEPEEDQIGVEVFPRR